MIINAISGNSENIKYYQKKREYWHEFDGGVLRWNDIFVECCWKGYAWKIFYFRWEGLPERWDDYDQVFIEIPKHLLGTWVESKDCHHDWLKNALTILI